MAERRLVLARHAKAAWPDAVEDIDRPLTGRGRRDAAELGRWLAGRGLLPDVVLCSPARRTRETWELAGQALVEAGTQAVVVLTDALYDAPARRVLAAVAGVPDDALTVLLLGHNPGVEDAVGALAGRPARMRTAGVAVLSCRSWTCDDATLLELTACRG